MFPFRVINVIAFFFRLSSGFPNILNSKAKSCNKTMVTVGKLNITKNGSNKRVMVKGVGRQEAPCLPKNLKPLTKLKKNNNNNLKFLTELECL